MRELLLKLMGLSLLSFFGNMLLPEGNMKKYASLLLSFVVCACFISSLGGGLDAKLSALPESLETASSDTFHEEVMAEYKKRAEAEIEKHCGAKAEIETDENYNITHVKFYSTPRGTSFLTDELEVSENEIEISDK